MRVLKKFKGVLDHKNLKVFIRIEGVNLYMVDDEIATLTIQIATTMTTIDKNLETDHIVIIETRGVIFRDSYRAQSNDRYDTNERRDRSK
jgi:hypothetical protein